MQRVNQLSSGRAPGIDGIPTEVYKTFWGIIGKYFFKDLQESYKAKVLPKMLSTSSALFDPKEGRSLSAKKLETSCCFMLQL